VKETWKRDMYRTLRIKCGFTHHEARRILLDNYGTYNHFKDMIHEEAKKEAEAFQHEINAIVVQAISAPTVEEASLRIFNACWPHYPDRDIGPILPYLVASKAATSIGKHFNVKSGTREHNKLWYNPKKILVFENTRARQQFKKRNISTYMMMKYN
jgi:hypothetical protein